MDSKKTRKMQDLIHATNEKMDAIAKEMSNIRESNMDEKEKSGKIRALEQDFRQLLEDEKKQIEDIEME